LCFQSDFEYSDEYPGLFFDKESPTEGPLPHPTLTRTPSPLASIQQSLGEQAGEQAGEGSSSEPHVSHSETGACCHGDSDSDVITTGGGVPDNSDSDGHNTKTITVVTAAGEDASLTSLTPVISIDHNASLTSLTSVTSIDHNSPTSSSLSTSSSSSLPTSYCIQGDHDDFSATTPILSFARDYAEYIVQSSIEILIGSVHKKCTSNKIPNHLGQSLDSSVGYYSKGKFNAALEIKNRVDTRKLKTRKYFDPLHVKCFDSSNSCSVESCEDLDANYSGASESEVNDGEEPAGSPRTFRLQPRSQDSWNKLMKQYPLKDKSHAGGERVGGERSQTHEFRRRRYRACWEMEDWQPAPESFELQVFNNSD